MRTLTLDSYFTLDEVAQKYAVSVEAMRLRLKRRQIPTQKILGRVCVLKVSIEEARKRENAGR